jgi:hypothetical protein
LKVSLSRSICLHPGVIQQAIHGLWSPPNPHSLPVSLPPGVRSTGPALVWSVRSSVGPSVSSSAFLRSPILFPFSPAF